MNNLVKINSVEHLTAMVKAIVPRSFEKTFGGLSTDEVVAGFTFCVIGLTQTELNTGLAKVREMGFCPDPAMFAKWCKGLDGFNNTDHIADSYIGKSGALANILLWLADKSSPISVAEKQAYDKTYHMFNEIEYASNADFARSQACSSFKDAYEFIVRKLIADRQMCQMYTPPVALEHPKQTVVPKPTPADTEFVNGLFAKMKAANKLDRLA